MPSRLPHPGVVRVSLGAFDPVRFPEVERMTQDTGAYLIPAIGRLPGLSAYFAGASPSGSIVHVSVWESDAHAQQMAELREMTINARRDADVAGVSFSPIVNYPIKWRI